MMRDETTAGAYDRPSPVVTPVESVIAHAIVRRVAWVGPVVIAAAAVLGGVKAAWSAGVGLAIVVAYFLLSGWVLSRSARVSLRVYHAAALFGFFGRLAFIAVSMFLVAALVDVDRTVMGVAAVVAYLALLTLEARAVLKGERRELEWSN